MTLALWIIAIPMSILALGIFAAVLFSDSGEVSGGVIVLFFICLALAAFSIGSIWDGGTANFFHNLITIQVDEDKGANEGP